MKLPLITNIQKYSIHDGKGIRTTVFFKGCPLSCRWCHNPETQDYGKELLFYEERCTGCGACAQECPNGAVMPASGKAYTKRQLCSACGDCADSCVRNARQVCGRTYSVRELTEELLKDSAFYETSDGGVTLSGGEALAQDPDYLEALMCGLFRRGISINVDTCGAVPFPVFERVLPYTDTFLYDLKLMEEEKHREYTGWDNRQILENLKRLSGKGARIWIRIPVIGGVNDGETQIGRMADFLREEQIHAGQVNLIPYHKTGSGKYRQLGRDYQDNAFSVPSEERMQQLRELLGQRSGIPVFLGG